MFLGECPSSWGPRAAYFGNSMHQEKEGTIIESRTPSKCNLSPHLPLTSSVPNHLAASATTQYDNPSLLGPAACLVCPPENRRSASGSDEACERKGVRPSAPHSILPNGVRPYAPHSTTPDAFPPDHSFPSRPACLTPRAMWSMKDWASPGHVAHQSEQCEQKNLN